MKVLKSLSVIAMLAIILASCKKDNQNNNQESRAVRYEITGNYTGKLNIVFTDETGNFQTLTNVSLPWNKSFTAGTGMQSATLTASTTSTSTVGVAGQTATAKLYIGTVLKKTVTQTADATGRIQFGNIIHVF